MSVGSRDVGVFNIIYIITTEANTKKNNKEMSLYYNANYVRYEEKEAHKRQGILKDEKTGFCGRGLT